MLPNHLIFVNDLVFILFSVLFTDCVRDKGAFTWTIQSDAKDLERI